MNWHNTFLSNYRNEEWLKLYKEIILKFSEKH